MPVPALSPIRVENLICYGCSGEMRHHLQKMANGRPVGLVYFCDHCKYGFEARFDHASGTMPSKYRSLEEIVKAEEESSNLRVKQAATAASPKKG